MKICFNVVLFAIAIVSFGVTERAYSDVAYPTGIKVYRNYTKSNDPAFCSSCRIEINWDNGTFQSVDWEVIGETSDSGKIEKVTFNNKPAVSFYYGSVLELPSFLYIIEENGQLTQTIGIDPFVNLHSYLKEEPLAVSSSIVPKEQLEGRWRYISSERCGEGCAITVDLKNNLLIITGHEDAGDYAYTIDEVGVVGTEERGTMAVKFENRRKAIYFRDSKNAVDYAGFRLVKE